MAPEHRLHGGIEPILHQVEQKEVLGCTFEQQAANPENHPASAQARGDPRGGPTNDLLKEAKGLTAHAHFVSPPVPEHLPVHGRPPL